MTLALIADAGTAGVRLWYQAGRVRYAGPREAVTSLLPRLAEHKAELAEVFRLEALAEAFEERAAIMEFDGGLSRADAERLAAECSEHALKQGQAYD